MACHNFWSGQLPAHDVRLHMDAATDAADDTRLHKDRSTAAEQNISTYEREKFAFVARTLGKGFT